MDPDSFLNPLSLELDELGDWYPSSPSPSSSSMDTPAHDTDAQARMNHPSLNSLAAVHHNSSHAQNAPYTSVLKLSDVASALLRGFSSAKPVKPPPAPLGLSKHGHALIPTGTFKRSSAEANVGGNHPENKMKMTKPFTILLPAGSSRPSTALPQAGAPSPSASPNPFSASPPLHDPLPETRPSKRMKTSSLGPTSTVSKDTEPFNREGCMSQRETHIYTERQRRTRMKESFSILQSLVPKLKLKHTNRIIVLTEVIKHIQSLRVTLEELERKRLDIMSLLGISEEDAMGLSPYWCIGLVSYNKTNCDDLDSQVKVTVRASGPDVFITLNAPKHKGVWSGVLMLLHKYDVEIVNATLATASGNNSFHCIHGKADITSSIESMDLQDKLERVILKQLSKQHKKI